MRIHLVSYENTTSWILGKLSSCLADELRLQGETVSVGQTPDPWADINHHVNYFGYDVKKRSTDTLMITHVDTEDKVVKLHQQLQAAAMGICISSDTMNKLAALGLPREKLSFINYPSPQQGKIQPRKISIGITSRCYAHGSKREYLLGELAPRLAPGDFVFHVMGQGWDAVIHELRRYGSDVVYHGDFDLDAYRRIWQQLDYYLYLGQDEGSTGLLDAMEAGVPTIAPPQGFHIDLLDSPTHAFNDIEELTQIFSELAEERNQRRRAVAVISWPNYARKHLVIWREVLNRRAGATLYPVTPEERSSVGISTGGAVTHAVPSPWLTRMPSAVGPGGAVHRPRLLLIADEPLEQLEDTWRNIIKNTPSDLPIVLNAAGRPSQQRVFPRGNGLEIKLADYRRCSAAEIVLLSFDFDAVGFWDIAPLEILKRLQRRSKTNYLLDSRRLRQFSERVQGGSVPRHWAQTLFFKFVHRLRTLSYGTTVSFWTRPVGVDREDLIYQRELAMFFSGVDLAVFTTPGWAQLMKSSNMAACCAETDMDNHSTLFWESVFHRLFEVIQAHPARQELSGWLRVIKKLGAWAYRLES